MSIRVIVQTCDASGPTISSTFYIEDATLEAFLREHQYNAAPVVGVHLLPLGAPPINRVREPKQEGSSEALPERSEAPPLSLGDKEQR